MQPCCGHSVRRQGRITCRRLTRFEIIAMRQHPWRREGSETRIALYFQYFIRLEEFSTFCHFFAIPMQPAKRAARCRILLTRKTAVAYDGKRPWSRPIEAGSWWAPFPCRSRPRLGAPPADLWRACSWTRVTETSREMSHFAHAQDGCYVRWQAAMVAAYRGWLLVGTIPMPIQTAPAFSMGKSVNIKM